MGVKDSIWRHKKTQGEYRIAAYGEVQASGGLLQEGDRVIVYRGKNGLVWVREENEFLDRFELVSVKPDRGLLFAWILFVGIILFFIVALVYAALQTAALPDLAIFPSLLAPARLSVQKTEEEEDEPEENEPWVTRMTPRDWALLMCIALFFLLAMLGVGYWAWEQLK